MGLRYGPEKGFSGFSRDISSSASYKYNWPKISPIIRLLAIQLCEKFKESATLKSRDMGLRYGPGIGFSGFSRDISSSAP